MRLAGQARGGYYPLPPEMIPIIASRLEPPPPGHVFTIIDPCAGEGEAIAQLGSLLNCPAPSTYAIELADDRAEKVKANLPGAKILAPCSFFGSRITYGSFSLAYCNPPFDDEIGGGQRVELTFCQRAAHLVRTHGVLCLVAPEDVVNRYEFARFFDTWFTNISIRPFPEEFRNYKEVVVLGMKRSKPEESNLWRWEDVFKKSGKGMEVYPLAPCIPPKDFKQTELTTSQIEEALKSSPLNRYLESPPETPLPEPPLPLSNGHIALLLASGTLDGIVRPPHDLPHVVRGTARKEQYLDEVQENENADGSTTVKSIYQEKIVLTIRAVDTTGELHTYE